MTKNNKIIQVYDVKPFEEGALAHLDNAVPSEVPSAANDNRALELGIKYAGNGNWTGEEIVYPRIVNYVMQRMTEKGARWNVVNGHGDENGRQLVIDSVIKYVTKSLERTHPNEKIDWDSKNATVAEMYDWAIEKWCAEREVQESSNEPSTSSKFVELADGLDLWHTPDLTAWARMPVKKHFENHAVKSTSFRQWLGHAYYKRYNQVASKHAVDSAIEQLSGRAQFDGKMQEVHLRLAKHDDAIWLDLCDDRWRAVRIDASGWAIENDVPVMFRRKQGMLPLPMPVQGGTIGDLKKFLNTKSDREFMLIASWLVNALRPRGPYPILLLNGEQGTGKSTLSKLLRMLIDPNIAPIRPGPASEQDLFISAMNGWILCFDNISGIKNSMSDAYCRVATGGGFSTRKLYTDDDEILIDVQRPMIFNGIPDLARRADFADRSIVIELPVIAQEQRQPESLYWKEFENDQPKLLGALLDAVSGALANENDVVLDTYPRMADFAKWVTAAEPALGWDKGSFMDAYQTNCDDIAAGFIESDALAVCLEAFINEANPIYEGTITDLMGALTSLEADFRAPEWAIKSLPSTPQGLSTWLKRITPNLRKLGYQVSESKKSGSKRTRRIAYIGKS